MGKIGDPHDRLSETSRIAGTVDLAADAAASQIGRWIAYNYFRQTSRVNSPGAPPFCEVTITR